jgi:hypothetical protein
MNIIEVNDTVIEPDDKQFIDEINKLIILFYTKNTKNDRITTCMTILNIIDKYSFIFNITKYNNFVSILKNKLYEFKIEKELKNQCYDILRKYYGEYKNKCEIYTLRGYLCNNNKNIKNIKNFKNICSKKICKIHEIAYYKRFNLLHKYLSKDITTICLDYCF